eukprot:scaffold1383_cov360-Prasinococcus_capsulatus_cf.AAC.9
MDLRLHGLLVHEGAVHIVAAVLELDDRVHTRGGGVVEDNVTALSAPKCQERFALLRERDPPKDGASFQHVQLELVCRQPRPCRWSVGRWSLGLRRRVLGLTDRATGAARRSRSRLVVAGGWRAHGQSTCSPLRCGGRVLAEPRDRRRRRRHARGGGGGSGGGSSSSSVARRIGCSRGLAPLLRRVRHLRDCRGLQVAGNRKAVRSAIRVASRAPPCAGWRAAVCEYPLCTSTAPLPTLLCATRKRQRT